MRYWLAPDVHAVGIAGDLVILDVPAETYFCVVNGGLHLVLGADGAVDAEPAAARDLVAAGLLVEAPSPAVRRAPAPITGSLARSSSRPVLGRVARAALANRRAGRAVADLSLADLLKLTPASTDAAFASPAPRLLEASSQFDRLVPWLPRDGVCLMRSLQQRLFLAQEGLQAAWVFGVRTWPFEAHCWLQAGGVVLDDSAEHAAGFVPILVV